MITEFQFKAKGDSTMLFFRGPENFGQALKARFPNLKPSKPFQDRFGGFDYGVFLRTIDSARLVEVEEWIRAGCPAGQAATAAPRVESDVPLGGAGWKESTPVARRTSAGISLDAAPPIRTVSVYVSVDGESYGPVTMIDAVAWAREGRFKETDWVFVEGGADWTAASNVPELESVFRGSRVTFAPSAPPVRAGASTEGEAAGKQVVLSLFRSVRPLGPVRVHVYRVQPTETAAALEQTSPVSLAAKVCFELQRLNNWIPVERLDIHPVIRVVSLEPLANLEVTRRKVQIVPEGEETLTLDEHRITLLRLIAQYIKWRLHARHRFQFGIYNEMQDPTAELSEGGVEVKRTYSFSLLNDAEGHLVLQMDQRAGIRSLRSVAEMVRAGENVDGLTVQRAYTLGTGYVTGVSQKRIVDFFEQINDTPASFYADVIQEFSTEIPDPATPAVFISYRKFSRGQDLPAVPQLLYPILTLEEIKARYPSLSKQVFHLLKRPVEERIRMSAEVVAKFSPLEALNLEFSTEPLRAGAGGFPGFRLYSCENRNNFLFGSNQSGAWIRSSLRRHSFFEKPEVIKIGLLYPQGAEADVEHLRVELRKQLEGAHRIRVEELDARHYETGGDNTMRYKVAANSCQRKGVDVVVAIVQGEFASESAYAPFKAFFAEKRIPSQMISLENVHNDQVYENIALSVVAKAGGQPWVLKEMPGENEAFIGIDVSFWKGKIAAAAHICDRAGRDIGWTVSHLVRGEKIPDETIVSMIENLLLKYQERNGAFPKSVVVHRDGFFRENLDLIAKLIADVGARCDLVEIRKSGAPRLAWVSEEEGGAWKNPVKGTIVVADERLAYLCSTGVSAEGKDDFWTGVPKPLTIVRLRGETPVADLARQVFWLSEMHVGSMLSVRLPITTYYSDLTASLAMSGLLPVGEVQDRPYCI